MTFTHSTTIAARAPSASTAIGMYSAISSSENFVTHVPRSQIARTTNAIAIHPRREASMAPRYPSSR